MSVSGPVAESSFLPALLCPQPAKALAKCGLELVSLLLRGPVPTVPCRDDIQTDVGSRQLWCLWPSEASQSLFCSRAAVRKSNSLVCQNSSCLRKLGLVSCGVGAHVWLVLVEGKGWV